MPRRPIKVKRRKSRTGETLTKKQKDYLKLRDFLGKLTPDEIVIAKENGLYKCDAYIKKRDGKKHVSTL